MLERFATHHLFVVGAVVLIVAYIYGAKILAWVKSTGVTAEVGKLVPLDAPQDAEARARDAFKALQLVGDFLIESGTPATEVSTLINPIAPLLLKAVPVTPPVAATVAGGAK